MKIQQPEFELYLKEILSFLRTVTIKFEPFETVMNNLYFGKIPIDEPDESNPSNLEYKRSYPYYLNLNGEYHSENTIMKIYDSKIDDYVDLTKDYIQNNPLVKETYLKDRKLYNSLLNQYPNQTDLIKGMFFPIPSKDEAIKAKNLTLLSYDSSYLYVKEREDMIVFLNSFLEYMNYRWYIPTFEYENLYPHTFWAMLWYLLPLVMVTRRIINTKTVYVHPYHIWEYLESKGFDGYKDILTDDQALYLYKNINYLLRNRGKQFVLDRLEEILLYPYNFSLSSKTIIHSTLNREEKAIWFPKVINERRGDIGKNSQSFSLFIYDMYTQGFDNKYSQEYINSVQDKFTREKDNILHTKFYEISRAAADDKYQVLFLGTQLDTIMFLYSKGLMNFTIDIEVSSYTVSLTIEQAIIMLFYLFLKYNDKSFTDDQLIPTNYNCTSCISKTKTPTFLEYPLYFYVGKKKFKTLSYMNLDEYYSRIIFPNENGITSALEFSELLNNQYEFIMDQLYYLNTTFDLLSHNCIRKQLYYLVPKFNITFDFPYTTFNDFLNSNKLIQKIITEYASSEDNMIDLVYTILNNISPMSEQINKYLNVDDLDNVFWKKIKELFINMSSYNVAFLLDKTIKLPSWGLPYIKVETTRVSLTEEIKISENALGCNNDCFDINFTIDSTESEPINIELSIDAKSAEYTKEIQFDPMDFSIIFIENLDKTIYIENNNNSYQEF